MLFSRGQLLAFNLFTRDILSCLACTRHVPITNHRKVRDFNTIKSSLWFKKKRKKEKAKNIRRI